MQISHFFFSFCELNTNTAISYTAILALENLDANKPHWKYTFIPQPRVRVVRNEQIAHGPPISRLPIAILLEPNSERWVKTVLHTPHIKCPTDIDEWFVGFNTMCISTPTSAGLLIAVRVTPQAEPNEAWLLLLLPNKWLTADQQPPYYTFPLSYWLECHIFPFSPPWSLCGVKTGSGYCRFTVASLPATNR